MSNAATTAPALLDSTHEIDATWMESVLAASHPTATIRGVTTAPIGAGNVSDTVKVAIDYANRPEGAPAAVIAKFKPSDPAVHAHGLGSGAYHREIGAYRIIGEQGACRIPRAFHVAGDETNINLVLEDLTHAVPGNQVAGSTPADAAAVLTELAALHATFTPMDTTTAPDWLIRMSEAADYWAGITRTGAETAVERYRDRLPTADLDLIAAAGELVRRWYLLPQTRLTVSHGDPRVDNVLFEQVEGRTRAVLIDWQVTGLRNPMYDVGYFLSGSLSAEDRRATEHDLIDGYLRTFSAITGGYPREEAVEDYRTQLLSGLMITTAAIAVLPDDDVVNTLILALLERNCAAAHDWDSIRATEQRIAR